VTKLESVKPYLDYLDMEVTIMRVLSAFAVAVPALIVERLAGADAKSALGDIWTTRRSYLLVGAGSFLVSALFFYRQGSLLAWAHGQLCLSQSPYADGVRSTRDLLEEADAWRSWLHYRWAFAFLLLGFVLYGFAFTRSPWPERSTLLFLPLFTVIACFVHTRVLLHFPDSETPWRALWDTIRRR